jgi:hypothetical protein
MQPTTANCKHSRFAGDRAAGFVPAQGLVSRPHSVHSRGGRRAFPSPARGSRHAAAGSTGRSLLRNGRWESPFVATRSANGAACKLTDFLRKGCLDIIDWQVRLSKRMGAGENEAL